MWCENTSFQFPLFHPEYCVFLSLGSSWTILFIHDRINSLADATRPPPPPYPSPPPPSLSRSRRSCTCTSAAYFSIGGTLVADAAPPLCRRVKLSLKVLLSIPDTDAHERRGLGVGSRTSSNRLSSLCEPRPRPRHPFASTAVKLKNIRWHASRPLGRRVQTLRPLN